MRKIIFGVAYIATKGAKMYCNGFLWRRYTIENERKEPPSIGGAEGWLNLVVAKGLHMEPED